jgi:glucokinase
MILLGGGVMRSAGLFLDEVRQFVYAYATQVPTNRLRIELVDAREDAGLRGAAAVWLHRYRNVGRVF